jgi:uncharacterized protein with von Willebrand factor type A (vWA) domain
MGATRVDLAFNYRGLRQRSRTIKTIEAQAEQKGIKYPALGEDLFNLLYQKSPILRDDLDPNSKYTDIIRSVANSPSLNDIRSKTRGDVHWSGLGASVLLAEIANKIDMSNEPPPVPPTDEPKEKDTSDSDDDSDDDSESGGDDSDSDQDSEDDSDGDGEESDDDSDSDEPSNENENDETGNEDNGEPGTNRGNNPDGEPDDSDDDSDSESESGEGESEDDDSDSEDNDDSDSDGSDSDDDSDSEEDSESESEPQRPSNKESENEPEQIDPNSSEIDEAIQKAIDEASEKLVNQLGGMSASKGEIQNEPEKIQAMDAYVAIATNRYIYDIFEQIGRLKLDNRFFTAMTIGDPEETVGITWGKDLKEALPSSIALAMGDDAEFFKFATDWDGGKLLIRENKSKDHIGKGPIVACIDRSGSMDTQRTQWATTLCMALYMQAVKEKRPFALVQFGSWARLDLPNSDRILDERFLTQITSRDSCGGGTNFEHAWGKAIDFIEKQSSTSFWKYADIAFITDGRDHFYKEQWLKQKAKHNLRLFTMIIGMSEAQATQVNYFMPETGKAIWVYSEIQNLSEVSDGMMYIENLDSADANTAFTMVKSPAQMKG